MNNNICFINLLKYICFLQENNNNEYNTRIITLYNNKNEFFMINYIYKNKCYKTPYLRIEKITDNWAYFRLLYKWRNKYKNSNNFVTVNINEISAIKFVQDIRLY